MNQSRSVTIVTSRSRSITIASYLITILSRSYPNPITIVIITIVSILGSIAKVGSSTHSVNRCAVMKVTICLCESCSNDIVLHYITIPMITI